MNKIKINKILISVALVYIITFLNTYYSMLEYKNNSSSACFNCSYLQEIMRYSFVSILIIIPVLILMEYIKTSKNIKLGILVICLFFILFIVNYFLFDARVASWSTYLFSEISISVLNKMIYTGSISIVVFYLYIKFFYLNEKNI